MSGYDCNQQQLQRVRKKHQIGFHFAARLALNHNTKERRVSWKTENEGVNLEFALSAAVTHIHTLIQGLAVACQGTYN